MNKEEIDKQLDMTEDDTITINLLYQKVELLETILDKVTDKLKEDMKESKEKIKYYENQYRLAKEKEDKFYIKSHHRQINRLQSRFETLREILYIVEGKKNGTI